jgi:hypothetical protein
MATARAGRFLELVCKFFGKNSASTGFEERGVIAHLNKLQYTDIKGLLTVIQQIWKAVPGIEPEPASI